MGLTVPVAPDGAFYAWADCSALLAASSWDFCFDMMQRAHVALTPGRDFGPAAAERLPAPVLRQQRCRSCEQALARLAARAGAEPRCSAAIAASALRDKRFNRQAQSPRFSQP